MSRIPIRTRLTVIIAGLLVICCIILTVCVMNTGIMKLDSVQAEVMNISLPDSSDLTLSIDVSDIYPEINEIIGKAKSDLMVKGSIVMLCVITAGAFLTWLVGLYALKPVKTLCEEVERTTEENLYTPVSVPDSRDEVRQLALSFNNMRKRLNAAFTAQKQFSANAAHELRTPLSVMQTSLEVFNKKESITIDEYREVTVGTLRQVERLNKLVEGLLEFQSMHTAELNAKVYAADIAEEVICDLEERADEHGVSLEFHNNISSDKQWIQGNEVFVYRAIFNLVENAVKYNKENGRVIVSVSNENSGMTVKVEDTGKGIPEDQWNRIFDPFYRVDKSRSRKLGGAGLGLAMVKEIAKAHNGDVCVESSSEQGTVMCLRLG